MKRATFPIAFMLGVLTLVAGCGKEEALRPAAGHSLPQKPAMAHETPTTDDLLTPGTEARQNSDIEAMRHSQERKPDPFDLPPN